MKLQDPDPLVTIEALCRRFYFQGCADAVDGDDTTWRKSIKGLRETLGKAFERGPLRSRRYSIAPRGPILGE